MFSRCALLWDERRHRWSLLTNSGPLFWVCLYRGASFISAWRVVMFPVPPFCFNCPRTISSRPCCPDLLCAKPMLHNLCFKRRYQSFFTLWKMVIFSPPPPRLNVHRLKNDTSSKYCWAKGELYNFPISWEPLSVERRNYMAVNGFLNSDITS